MSDDIRQARKAAGLTRTQLAARSGVSERTIATVEGGGRVSEASRAKLAAALKGAAPEPPEPSRRRREDSRVAIPSRQAFRDLPIIGTPSWDSVQAVRGALTQMDQLGQFSNAALLMDAMLQDDRIVGTISARFDGLLGLPMEMRPPEGMEEDGKALEICEAARKDFPRIAPESTLRTLLRWGRGLGVGLAEKLWDTNGERWVPRLKVWHPRFMYWRWDTRTFHTVTEGDGAVEIRVGPDVPANEQDRHWLLYTPYGYGRDAWINSLIRSLAVPWLIRQWAYRDWARYSEVHGLPIRKLKMPSEWSDEERERALREVGQLASESVIRCIQDRNGVGFDLLLEEAKANTWEGFQKLIDKTDVALSIAILGQNLTTEVKEGSRAAAQVHQRVRDDILRSDAETLSTVLREGVLKDWAAYNFGDPELAPWPHWHVEPPEDKKAEADGYAAVGAAITALESAGVPLDKEEFCERFSVPVEEGAEFGESLAIQAAEAAANTEPDDDADDKGKPKKAAMTALAARGRVPAGVREGQRYVDELVGYGITDAAELIGEDVRALLRIIRDTPGQEGKPDGAALKRAILAHYRGMDPERLTDLNRKLAVLAQLNGRRSVLEDL